MLKFKKKLSTVLAVGMIECLSINESMGQSLWI